MSKTPHNSIDVAKALQVGNSSAVTAAPLTATVGANAVWTTAIGSNEPWTTTTSIPAPINSVFKNINNITEELALAVIAKDDSAETMRAILENMAPQTETVVSMILEAHPSLWRNVEPCHDWAYKLTNAARDISTLGSM